MHPLPIVIYKTPAGFVFSIGAVENAENDDVRNIDFLRRGTDEYRRCLGDALIELWKKTE